MKKIAAITIVLCVVSVGMLSGCISGSEGITGILMNVPNPATSDPPLPGMVWAIGDGDIWNPSAYLWDEGDLLWSYDDIQKYGSFSEGQRVRVTGSIETKYDVFGGTYDIIQVEKIEDV